MRTALPLGRIVITNAAADLLTLARVLPGDLLIRHRAGDWGDVDDEDRAVNDEAARHGGRIVSSYKVQNLDEVWIITERDRSVTTILLPSDY